MAASEQVTAGGIEGFQKWAAEEAETITTMLKGQPAASSSAPNAQADGDDLSKKQLKRQRQRAKQDLKDVLGRDPNDQEVADFLKAAEETRARAPRLSGPAQPKRVMHEMAYTGMPVAKAAPKPNDAREGNPEPDAFQAGGTSTAEGGGEGNPELDAFQAGRTLRIPVAASGSSDAMPAGDADDPIGDI